MTEYSTINPPIDPPIEGRKGITNADRLNDAGLLTFNDVEARLVEAMQFLWQLPDRERGWLHVKASWPDVLRHTWFGDYGDTDPDAPEPKLPLSRAQIAAMDEALGWLDPVPVDDRKLIGLALRRLAAGADQVPWAKLIAPMGVNHTNGDALRMRYERAMGDVTRRVNGGFSPL